MKMTIPTLLMSVDRYRTRLSLQDIIIYNGSIYIIESISQYQTFNEYGSSDFSYYTFHLTDLILYSYLTLNITLEELDTKLTYLKKTPNLMKLLNLK